MIVRGIHILELRMILLVVCLSTLGGFGAAAEQLFLAKNGKAEVVIVVDKEAAAPALFAAMELRRFLGRISNASFEIVTELQDDQSAIIIGDTQYTRAAGIDTRMFVEDEYVIRSVGNRIFIAGRDTTDERAKKLFTLMKNPEKEVPWSERIDYMGFNWDFEKASLYGTYRFLESLGVRWFFPGPKGEVVPKKPLLAVNSLSIQRKPHFLFRNFTPEFWHSPVDSGKAGSLHSATSDPSEYKALGWSVKRDMLWRLRMGNLSRYLPLNHRIPREQWQYRFGKSHPEYFALLPNGKRDLPKVIPKRPNHKYWSHLCYSNPGVFKETIADINAFFSGREASTRGIDLGKKFAPFKGWNPSAAYGNTFSLLPNDVFKPCTGPACSAQINPESYTVSSSDLVWGFVDKVARQVEKDHPGKTLTCLAYESYSTPPKRIKKLPANVLVGLCPYPYQKVHKTVSPKGMKRLMDYMEAWGHLTQQPMAVWLHQLYRRKQPQHTDIPMIFPHHIARLMKNLSGKVRYAFIQLDCDSPIYEHLNRYIFNRVVWNPDADVDAIIDDYVTTFYGSLAAEPMREFFRQMEIDCVKIASSGAGRRVVFEQYFNAERIKYYKDLLGQARALAKDPLHRQRLELISTYLVGRLERALRAHRTKISKVTAAQLISIVRTRSPILIDGVIDEAAWAKSNVYDLVNNVNGKPTSWKTAIRLLYDEKNLYFSFVCTAPGVKKDLVEKSFELIEIFLDTNANQDSYHQILISNDGTLKDNFFEGGGEQGNDSWRSGAQRAIKFGDTGYTMEVAVPLAKLQEKGVVAPGARWGINLCRTLPHPPQPNEKFNTLSRLIVGSFAQPDMFARLYFVDKAVRKIVPLKSNLLKNGSFEKWGNALSPTCWQTNFRGSGRARRDDTVVHSGQSSLCLDTGGAFATASFSILPQGAPIQHAYQMVLSDGTYRLSFFWHSSVGSISLDLKVLDDKNKQWHHYNPTKHTWFTTEKRNVYHLFSGKKNTWNHTEIVFPLDFPRRWGALVFYPGAAKKHTLFIDDVSLVIVNGA